LGSYPIECKEPFREQIFMKRKTNIKFRFYFLIIFTGIISSLLAQVNEAFNFEYQIFKGRNAWRGLVRCIHPEGYLGYCQTVSRQPGHVATTDTDWFGQGLFLLAATEVLKMMEKQ